jgi:predicted metal-dependent peptidase
VLLPTLDGARRRVIAAVDTSMSIAEEKLSAFLTELAGIVSAGPCEGVLLACDAAIQEELPLTDLDFGAIKRLRGGGGTSFVPVFERAAEEAALGRAPDALIYFTDLAGIFPREEPPWRVIWVVSQEDAVARAPFGEVIVIEE